MPSVPSKQRQNVSGKEFYEQAVKRNPCFSQWMVWDEEANKLHWDEEANKAKLGVTRGSYCKLFLPDVSTEKQSLQNQNRSRSGVL